jgi:Flp pilus assembly protein TadD
LLELTGDLPGAETVLRTALVEDPSLPQISKNLADILYRNGRFEEAREAYERAAKLAPDLGDDLYFKLGNIAYKRRDTARARESWSQATSLNPGHELARANLDMLDLAQ